MRRRYFHLIIGLTVSSFQAWAEPTVKIMINPSPENDGQVILALCNQEHFPHEDRCTIRKTIPAKEARQSITLTAPEPGRYAILVINDVNKNNKLDTNLIGIPKEPVGVSRNPALRFGPPRFEDAAIDLSGSDKEIIIDLKRVEK
jgi:uncharacterized protein (DUF2141 family)